MGFKKFPDACNDKFGSRAFKVLQPLQFINEYSISSNFPIIVLDKTAAYFDVSEQSIIEQHISQYSTPYTYHKIQTKTVFG